MDSEVSGYLRQMTVLTRHVRKVFLIAVLICGLLVLNVTFLREVSAGPPGGIRSCFGPLLLWALTAATYAFHSLAAANARLTEKVGGILEAERARALRQLAAIKTRLRASASGTQSKNA